MHRDSCVTLRATPTALLEAWGRGDRAAFDALVPLVHDELKRIARRHMRSERGEHTLQPSALVNEALHPLARRHAHRMAEPRALLCDGRASDAEDPGGLRARGLVDTLSYNPVWSPDGRFIVYSEQASSGGGQFQVRAITPEKAPVPLPKLLVGYTIATPYRFTPNGEALIALEGTPRAPELSSVSISGAGSGAS